MSQHNNNKPDVHVISDDEDNEGYEMVNNGDDNDDVQIVSSNNNNNNNNMQGFADTESLITIEWRDNTFPLLINLHDTTLAQLKRVVELNAKVPMSSQKYIGLHFNNSKPRSEQEYYTLAALGVKPDAVLKLLAPTPEEVAQVQAPPAQSLPQQQPAVSVNNNFGNFRGYGSQVAHDEDEEMAAAIAASLQDHNGPVSPTPYIPPPQRLISSDFHAPQSFLPHQQPQVINDDDDEEIKDGDDDDDDIAMTSQNAAPAPKQPSYSIKDHFFGDQKSTVDSFIFENCPFDDGTLF